MGYETDSREETKRRLLAAAKELFAERGFAETSVRDLARLAKCNVASITYHFGSKEKLYEAVMLSLLGELAQERVESLRQLWAEAGSKPALCDVLRRFAEAFLRPFFTEERGKTLRLLLGEMMHPMLPRDVLERELLHPVQAALKEALEAAAPGLRAQEIPMVTYSFISQLIQIVHLHLFAPKTAPAFFTSPQVFIDHVVTFTEGGIRALLRPHSQKVGEQ